METDDRYAPPTSEKARRWWDILSTALKGVVREAFEYDMRPYPWNVKADEEWEVMKLDEVSPFDVLHRCREAGVKLKADEWAAFNCLEFTYSVCSGRVGIDSDLLAASISKLSPKSIAFTNTYYLIPPERVLPTSAEVGSCHLIHDLGEWGSNFRSFREYIEDTVEDFPANWNITTAESMLSSGVELDLVIAEMPDYLAVRSPEFFKSIGPNTVIEDDEKQIRDVIKVLALLSENGTGFVGGRFSRLRCSRTEDELNKVGLHVVAVARDLAVVRRRRTDTISFVENESDSGQLECLFMSLANCDGSTPDSVIAVPKEQFTSRETTKLIDRYRGLSKRSAIPMVQPSSASDAELNWSVLYHAWIAQADHDHHRTFAPDAIPTVAEIAAHVELQRYLTGWLLSPIGRVYGEILDSGDGIPWPAEKLPPVPLPNVDQRREILTLVQKLNRLEEESRDLQSVIWSSPNKIHTHQESFRQINANPTAWIDHLPFPLSAILWQARTVRTARERVDLHLKFLEGLAMFHATVQLSIAVTDESLKSDVSAMLDELKAKGCGLERATFGTWVQICARLGKCFRQRSNKGSSGNTANHVGLSPAMLKEFVRKEWISLFKTANEHRNRMSGHGPAVSDDLASEWANQLEDLITTWRGLAGDFWHHVRLIQAGERMSRIRGAFHCEIRSLTGVRQPFQTETLLLDAAPDAECLHLHQIGEDTALPLLPFIQIDDPPAGSQAACYFYNRQEADGVKYVAYSYTNQPEVSFDLDPTAFLPHAN